MTTYGLTGDGFSPKTFDVIRADIDAALRAAFGSSLSLGDRSILGQISAIIAERYALLWELAEVLYSSQDPDKASGAALDALCLLTGTFRPQALGSTVTLTLTGTPLTVVASGSQASAATSLTLFSTVRSATIATVAVWGATTAYIAGARVTHAGNVYQCTTAGVSAGSGGPTGTTTSIADGSVVWDFLGVGTGATDVDAIGVVAGPLVAVARDITVKETPVGGWSSVINVLDAVIGRDIYSDEELRPFREAELAGQGNSPIDSIRAALLKLTDTVAATVFVNNTDVTNGDGLPPHSVECLIRGRVEDADADALIAATLLANVAAGIATFSAIGAGQRIVTTPDSEGVSQTIQYSRPSKINIYVDLTLTYDASLYPSDGDSQVKLAIIEWGDALSTGRDAVGSTIGAQAFQTAGVLSVFSLAYNDVITAATAWTNTHGYVATPGARSHVTNDSGRHYICITSGTSAGSGGPTGTSANITDGTVHWQYVGPESAIAISTRQLAVYDTSRITVHSSGATP